MISEMARMMMDAEIKSAAFAAKLWEQRDRARNALMKAREKLEIYRLHSDGNYSGGMEHTALIRLIDEALK